jgi:hypothetical protein
VYWQENRVALVTEYLSLNKKYLTLLKIAIKGDL